MSKHYTTVPVSEFWKVEGWVQDFEGLLSALSIIGECVIEDAGENESTKALDGIIIALQNAKAELAKICVDVNTCQLNNP